MRLRATCLALLVTTALLLPAFSAHAQVGNNVTLLNPNLATRAELAAVPHIGDAIADKLVKGRPWLNMVAVNNAIGQALTDEQRNAVYSRLWLPINLNTAGRIEILMIPGVGERMAHEFEEYRMYAALAQFRREMGKYVDEEEVARLEQYVFVPLGLNTATEEDLATIPGITPRVVRIFAQYRPYASMGAFDREMDKHVSANELARLKRYVTIRRGERAQQ
jgi:DNA uptake protein ComE-like DNA-binding protein